MKLFIFLTLICYAMPSWSIDCEHEKKTAEYHPRYAQLFSIRYFKDFKIVDSVDDHFLVKNKNALSCETKLPIFSANVTRFAATSTTHLYFLKALGLEKTLIGFQGVRYIYNPLLKSNEIKDINYQMNPEELLSLRADLIMAYSANLTSRGRLDELRKVGIPMVLNRDFQEKHPLARAEWMIFSAVFFSKDLEAQKLFKEIEEGYQNLARENATITKKPLVLVGDIQNGRWATCGGKSDLAILINDAGAELLLRSESAETQYFSLEKILSQKEKAKFWLSQNTWSSKDMAMKDSRYKTFINLPLYNNNRLLNKDGFNDYWEMGIGRPDLLLKELSAIFHDEKEFNTHALWYKKLK